MEPYRCQSRLALENIFYENNGRRRKLKNGLFEFYSASFGPDGFNNPQSRKKSIF
ncbi:hypothetical protein LEP1GSC040_1102 [Leptospira santarosai str. 2000030832]|nr:hypothetical protein LEP1GSC040_1102 [Leptospira santarosai str. 2000030832]